MNWTQANFNVNEHAVTYQRINAEDHKLLTNEQLNAAADAIDNALQKNPNGNVYVHCRGGVGRSAQAVAGYLIKYKQMTAQAAANLIKTHRKESTIHKKMEALEQFKKYCENQNSNTSN